MKKILLIGTLMVLSCSRAEDAPTSAKSIAAPVQLARTSAESAAQPASEPAADSSPRMIVRRAELRLVVADTSKTVETVTATIERMGGFVSASNVWREGELLRARMTLRVPADRLTPALAAIRAFAERVDNEAITSEDVSQEYVDLDARIRNLEATEEELRQLLVVARQNSRKAADVLEVHRQLMEIRGEIEQARGRARHLSQITAMSTIALDLMPNAIAQPVVEPGWQPLVVAKNAMRALVGVMQSVADVMIWLLIYATPLVLCFVLVGLAAWKLGRRVREKVV